MLAINDSRRALPVVSDITSMSHLPRLIKYLAVRKWKDSSLRFFA